MGRVGRGPFIFGAQPPDPRFASIPLLPSTIFNLDPPPGKVADAVSELNRLTVVVTTKAVSK